MRMLPCLRGGCIPVSDYSHCKTLFSYIKMKPLPVQLVPVAPALSVWLLLRGESLHLSTATFSVLEYCDEVLPEFPLGWEDLTPSGCPHRAGSSALWLSLWTNFAPFPVHPHLLWLVGTRAGHSTAGVAWWALSETLLTHICTQKWSLRVSYPRNVTLERRVRRWGGRHKVACWKIELLLHIHRSW